MLRDPLRAPHRTQRINCDPVGERAVRATIEDEGIGEVALDRHDLDGEKAIEPTQDTITSRPVGGAGRLRHVGKIRIARAQFLHLQEERFQLAIPEFRALRLAVRSLAAVAQRDDLIREPGDILCLPLSGLAKELQSRRIIRRFVRHHRLLHDAQRFLRVRLLDPEHLAQIAPDGGPHHGIEPGRSHQIRLHPRKRDVAQRAHRAARLAHRFDIHPLGADVETPMLQDEGVQEHLVGRGELVPQYPRSADPHWRMTEDRRPRHARERP